MVTYDRTAVGQQLPAVTRRIAQIDINRYATVSGSDGRSHIDEEYAKQVFGSTLAQGMMIVDGVSQVMAASFSTKQWLTTGKLEAKFIGMVRPGDFVTSRLTVTRKEILEGRRLVTCDFSCENQKGEKAVVGTARCELEE